MRFLSTLYTATLLIGGVIAAKKSSADRFDEFQAKSQNATPLKLSEVSYKTLTSSPRDYSVAVLLTALESRFNCQLCREFQPEWELLAKSWNKGDKAGETRLLYGTLDFVDGRDVFVSLGLQTAPVLLLFQPTEGQHAVSSPEPIRYDFSTGPPTAEQIRGWVAKHLTDRPHPEIKRPINWLKWLTSLTVVLGGATVLATTSRFVLPFVQSRNTWAGASLFAILFFISAQMFNRIRSVPYVAGNGRGGVTYFSGNFQNQLGLETQLVAVLYGAMSLCAIFLAVKVPKISEVRSQQVAVFAWGGILFVLYSFLLSIFRIKNGGYPFSLPPFM